MPTRKSPKSAEPQSKQTRLLVKLRPSSMSALRAAESRANLRPLFESSSTETASFGIAAAPRWFIADLPDGADRPWDLAHARVADQLGVSSSDVVFVEPDMVVPDAFVAETETDQDKTFAAVDKCLALPQDGNNGKSLGPDSFAWHLGDDYTELDKAREAVKFANPRTRIAHIDTGYYRSHETVPAFLRRDLERNFVENENPISAEDPDNRVLLMDNSGHGTGTIGILAGKAIGDGIALGGAPEAEVVPIRVADRVALIRTSSLARALEYAAEQLCDVVTLSMGGVPSRAWGDAVDKAYEAGVCICAAAGNHIGVTPPRKLVYPARYPRVIAVCGVMADGKPYADLKGANTLEGSFGPASAMNAAIASYTPNIPWPLFMCGTVIRLNGEGTSAATPQVAAAAALWLEKYKDELPRDWRRVEAVRHALFSSAKLKSDKEHFGNGVLQANKALRIKPDMSRQKSDESTESFAFLRVLTGLGVMEPSSREQMFNLELSQRWLLNEKLQDLLPDPRKLTKLDGEPLRKFVQEVIDDDEASLALRRHLMGRYPVLKGALPLPKKVVPGVVPAPTRVCDEQPELRNPPYRRVRVYAVDPSLSGRFETAGSNEVTLKVRWEELTNDKRRGPIGEYISVEDIDENGKVYKPVDLDDPRLLARDGWAPSEGNPQFHQQMVYAVGMKTIEHFEQALGRPVLWRPRPDPKKPKDDRTFVRRLTIKPHAMQQVNAFYSCEEVALKFGYFDAAADDPGDHVPGTRIYSCLSHDIIAHETTHAILDGMHRRFNEPTNADVLALHEAFADIVALMQHFTIPEILVPEIARTRGDLEAESMLGSLAIQFGRAMGSRAALRNAIGRMENGVWKRLTPDPAELQKRLTPHSRGAILVAAVFDAFLNIYKSRIADLLRLSTGGTGNLPNGAIHPDLVKRLADEATKSASHVLNMCVRAVDYLPPVDVTFFEYLRAIITADFDLVSDDRHNYRVAFVEAFRRRGIYPIDIDDPQAEIPRTLSPDTLRWAGLDNAKFGRAKLKEQYTNVLEGLKRYADQCLYINDRLTLFDVTRIQRIKLHDQLKKAFAAVPEFARGLGINPERESFEVHELRRAMRLSPDGRQVPQVVVALTQSQLMREKDTPAYWFHGGSTLIVDLSRSEVKYCIKKMMRKGPRQKRSAEFAREVAKDPLRALFFSPTEPFAALHALADDQGL